MELRHLRYFVAVAEAANFTRAAAKLRIVQPALSRQVADLEDEIGVDLFRRSPRGVTLTAEGRLFLDEARELLERADLAVDKVRALARGQFGDLHVAYAASPTVEILPPALAAFQKEWPRVNVHLHDLSQREAIEGLQSGALELAVIPGSADLPGVGIEFETLQTYPFCVAFAPGHPFARLKTISLQKAAAEPLIGLRRRDYPEAGQILGRIFGPSGLRPRVAVECDGASSMITAVEAGRGIALVLPVFRIVSGKRLLYRPLAGTHEQISIGIARARNGDLTPAGQNFCQILRSFGKADVS